MAPIFTYDSEVPISRGGTIQEASLMMKAGVNLII